MNEINNKLVTIVYRDLESQPHKGQLKFYYIREVFVVGFSNPPISTVYWSEVIF